MFIAAAIVSVVLALACVMSGAGKVKQVEALTTQLTGLGVKQQHIPLLGALLLAGAVGLVVGLWWAPIGIAAAVCLALYFAGAVVTHLRAGDKNVAPVVVLMLLAVAAAVLRILSA
ncbi:DoxX-like protein [Sediminihabitans luteus]|uniref:DoxX-like protein n=1 Tax=Sediminihabitans luteus TaxID=1138585 RepID=A0A2M9D0Z0_9CELL|nr:DoxX family protein [Sediminihabitans luteus]PJJ77852.1 DoxX-like protein [Sediminihabitans luteus]GII99790.1 hypothetical protein Slu03_21680 [Sediminihabitans luteus]